MGHAVGDWNNDGLMDWFSSAIMDNSTSFQTSWQFDDSGNKLYQNKGGRQFDDVTEKVNSPSHLKITIKNLMLLLAHLPFNPRKMKTWFVGEAYPFTNPSI